MIVRQYRWFSPGLWQSQCGNAIFTIINPILSGKKVVVHSVEIHAHKVNSGSYYPVYDIITGSDTLSASHIGGEVVTAGSHDTNSPLSSQIILRKNTSINASTNRFMTCVSPRLTTSSAWMTTALGNKSFRVRRGKSLSAWHIDHHQDAHIDPIILRQNEFLAIADLRTTLSNQECIPVEVQLTFRHQSKTYSCVASPCFLSNAGAQAFVIYNTHTNPVSIKRLFIRELGTADTPYFQLVPVGTVDANTMGDSSRIATPTPLDSNYGATQSGDPIIVLDSPLLPYGVPQQYIADGSTGSPKGYNYLHTKDFTGPVLFTMFPEYLSMSQTLAGGGFAWWNKARRITDSRANFILNEGEGIALVAGAETAVVTAAVGTSGWQPYDFAIQYSVMPKNIPVIKATGIVSGSTWAIQKKSTGALVAQGTVGGSNTIEYTYYDGDTPLQLILKVRKGTTQPLYKPYEVEFGLTTDGITIPVSQIPD